jgi:hypothetical protein
LPSAGIAWPTVLLITIGGLLMGLAILLAI